MKFKFVNKLLIFANVFLILILPLKSEELNKINSGHEFNIFTGMFDFSDDGKRSTILGFQHQNENLVRVST